MKKFIVGVVTGGLVVSAAFLILSDVLYSKSQRQLIDTMQMIPLGMQKDKVIEVLKAQGVRRINDIPANGQFPRWANRVVPQSYKASHGLVTCVIGSVGAHIVMIFYDENDNVTFISCAHT